jgi:hypothetical protein
VRDLCYILERDLCYIWRRNSRYYHSAYCNIYSYTIV